MESRAQKRTKETPIRRSIRLNGSLIRLFAFDISLAFFFNFDCGAELKWKFDWLLG